MIVTFQKHKLFGNEMIFVANGLSNAGRMLRVVLSTTSKRIKTKNDFFLLFLLAKHKSFHFFTKPLNQLKRNENDDPKIFPVLLYSQNDFGVRCLQDIGVGKLLR
ncbi:CLUMA_CG020535, isoform A [Clunio marinus]|uniref:CLUMA_CG020535, isoform A n=1 Tax=Clunio marinus TaxID=568069 RepID=A0A1J1J6H4_9DIPT|nr:CLUMA_CG020535, isoform A [Clunio marinus]